ncbi:MAG: hypothetical protein JXA28_05855 [Bacteroidetes bacterium]|nr:hypothetical protein [Bacteroidota bacterium]
MKRFLQDTTPRLMLKTLLLGLLLVGTVMQLHVGLADNGDYTRLLLWVTSGPSGFEENLPLPGTEAYELRFFNYVLPFWNFDMPWTSRWVSSILLVWTPGVALNALLFSTDTVYLPFISFAPRIFLLLFLLFLLRWIDRESGNLAPLLYLTAGLPFVLWGFNTEYVAYFTSFYQEPASMIGLGMLVLALVYYRDREDTRWRPWLSAVAVFFMTTAKLSNIHWAVLGALLLIPWKMLWLIRCRFALYVVLILLVPIGFTLLQATFYSTRSINAYQSIFCGTLMFSDRPADHIERLGMDGGDAYIGYHAYCPEGEEAMNRYAPWLNHSTVMNMIVHEPSIAWDMLVFAADSMQNAELTHLSKWVLYNETSARRPWARWLPASAAMPTPLNTWTRLKRAAFPTGIPLILITAALLPFFLWLRRHDRRLLRTFADVGILLALGVLTDMWMQIFGDGQRDLIKHLFLSNICFDGLVMVMLSSLVSLLGLRRHRSGNHG